jgi:hypothetical protein
MIQKFLVTVFLFASLFTSCEGQNSKKKSENISKKEKTNDRISSDSSNQLMNENEFWKIIDRSKTISGDYQEQINSLKTFTHFRIKRNRKI